ncbi:hypothetical protein [Mucilaginibacter sp. NFX135]|uniref:hypothetical protein n=1 Tax=Mucilaginibacter sp. NFX135 TaxID=3402687 RepID=UPI003AFA2B72
MIIYRPDILKRVVIFGVIGAIALIGLCIWGHYSYLSSNFNGRIDSVREGEKGDAIIIIKQKEYVLDGAWSYSSGNKVDIQKGDSIVKYKDSTQIKLIKPNGMTIIH